MDLYYLSYVIGFFALSLLVTQGLEALGRLR